MGKKLLEVKNLITSFGEEGKEAQAVRGISFAIERGQTLSIVGESGCGKSVTSLSIMRLIQIPPGKISETSQILYEGEDILKLPEEAMRGLRGEKVSMIFQEPMTSLNPVYTVGNQISEVFITHRGLSKKEANAESIKMLKLVAIPSPEDRIKSYPHELSGGMRQRVMIAMALACEPGLLIADEPTTALDITIQSQILKLIEDLKKRLNTAVMLITHNLGIVAQVSDRVIVMYRGTIVEEGGVDDIFLNPKHPYTEGLLKSVPILGMRGQELEEIPGIVPKPSEEITGCQFKTRCYKRDIMCDEEPELEVVGGGEGDGEGDGDLSEKHKVRCFKAE